MALDQYGAVLNNVAVTELARGNATTAGSTAKDFGKIVPREGVGVLSVPVGAASATVDAKIQGSADGSTGWTDVCTFTQVAAAASGHQFKKVDMKYRYYRTVVTLGAAVGFSVTLVGLRPMRMPVVQV